MNEISPSHMNKLQSSVNSFFDRDMPFDVIDYMSDLSGDYYVINSGGYQLGVVIAINAYVISYSKRP